MIVTVIVAVSIDVMIFISIVADETDKDVWLTERLKKVFF